MIITQEQLILKAQQQFDQIETFVRQACTEGRPLHEVKKDQPKPCSSERRGKGQKANQKRMSCVGGVYTIDPFVRTADDVVNEVLREQCRTERPCGVKSRI